MGAGSWTMACLLLLGQVPSDVVVTNQRGHKIPLDIEPGRRQEYKEFRLFVSRDLGKTWQQVDRVTPDQPEFVFTAKEEGPHWFRVAGLTRQDKQEPENLYKGPPDLKMVVDTIRPLISVSARKMGDEIAVAWDVKEDAPDLASLKVEYRTQDNPQQWTPVPHNPSLKGETRFHPGSPATVEVRVEMKDQAGNRGFGNAEVPGIPVLAAAPPPAGNTPAPLPPPVSAIPIAPPPLPDVRTSPPPLAEHPPPRPFPTGPVNSPRFDPNTRLVASSETIPGVPGSGVRKPLPPLQHVNHPEVMLEYELTKVGPSGIGSIEIFWTQNDGQTWEKYAVDDTVRPNMPTGTYQRMVDLNQGDGVYGFTMVIRNRVGKGKPEPRAGDVPELRIELDTVAPMAQLYAPQADPQRPGHLLLQWYAKDNNLTPAPITLEWSDRRDGTWHVIAVNQPNTGRFSWPLPEGLPYQVFLRLKVRDAAGNEGLAVTPDPQLVDLSEPEGRLLHATTVPPRR